MSRTLSSGSRHVEQNEWQEASPSLAGGIVGGGLVVGGLAGASVGIGTE